MTYTCPMHPEIVSDKPGMCPECGMNLIPRKLEVEKGKKEEKKTDSVSTSNLSPLTSHVGHTTQSFLTKFWISLALTVPVVLYSELPERLFGYRAPAFPGSAYLPLILSSIVFFYAGLVFLKGAWIELRARAPGMMTLIGIAVTAAYAYSAFVTFAGGDHTLFWELTTLVTIMLLGHWIEMRAVAGSQRALNELSKLLPDTAELVTGDKGHETRTVPLAELKEGDLVLVRPGGRIPADGAVAGGTSDVTESMITGESKPVAKNAGSEVVAGTVNGDGSLTIRVTKIGERTFLAGVMRLVAEAQASKSRLQLLSDRAAYYLTIIAIATGITAYTAWITVGAGFDTAIARFVAVLVIACPHALGLAIPLVASISTTLAARNGFLIRNRLALELARNVDVVLFDKTGTLTKGEYGIVRIIPNDKLQTPKSENEILALAASVDSHSEHFAARAIVHEAERRTVKLAPAEDFKRLPGKGVSGMVAGNPVTVGGEAMLADSDRQALAPLQETLDALGGEGKTLIYVRVADQIAGVIALADVIREESREAVAALTRAGVCVAMVTGDSEGVAAWVARELGVDEVFARVLPQEKAERVKLLQANGAKIAFVGDGVNDAPALTQADLGIAIGAGTNVAIESAGIILVRNDPRDIPKVISLAKRTYAKMLQNLFWATGYNVAAIPLAAGALTRYGIVLEPAFSAVLMSLSTVIVAANAMILRRVRL